jgi:hypothetical protein
VVPYLVRHISQSGIDIRETIVAKNVAVVPKLLNECGRITVLWFSHSAIFFFLSAIFPLCLLMDGVLKVLSTAVLPLASI